MNTVKPATQENPMPTIDPTSTEKDYDVSHHDTVVKYTINLPLDLYARLKFIAKKKGSFFISNIIRETLEREFYSYQYRDLPNVVYSYVPGSNRLVTGKISHLKRK